MEQLGQAVIIVLVLIALGIIVIAAIQILSDEFDWFN